MGRFHFSHQTGNPREQFLQRIFEVIPGFLSWFLLISLTALSFSKPLIAACVVIAFDIYWLLRISYMAIFLVLAYSVLTVEKETHWMRRCRNLELGEKALRHLARRQKAAGRFAQILRWFSLKNQERELQQVIREKVKVPPFDSIYHVVIIAAAKESREVVEPGLEAMIKGQFPTERIIPILAVEERAGESQIRMAQDLKQKFTPRFFDFLVSVHPDAVPGEAKVKGANVTFAAKKAAEFLKKQDIPFDHVIVSCFDADTVASPAYFFALTYHFMRRPDRTRASFQPIPVYHNNIWEAPGFARVLEMGSSFFQMVEATNPEKLVTFSSHSMSFKALVEIGYWPVDMISDDSAIFWKALIYYGGDYRVIPMYVTLSMDVVMAESRWKTLVNIYRQKRRWAWGVENFPIVMRAFLRDQSIRLWNKLRYSAKLLEMHVSWATMGFIVTFLGWLPAIFAGQEFSNSVVFYNSHRITGIIFNLASTALALTIILSLLLLPKQKTRRPFFARFLFAFEWLLVPMVFTFLSALPALDAQTRLMTGRRMEEFWVTEKKRKKR